MTNVFRTPGALIPSTCLSPFGPMNDSSFYAFSPSDAGGWPSMPPMSHRMGAPPGGVSAGGCGDPFGLPSSLQPRQGFVQSFSSPCAAMTGLGGYCSMTGLTNGGVSHSPTSAPGGPMYPSAPPPPPPPPYCMAANCESPLSAGHLQPPPPSSMTTCGMQDINDIWRGSSIATLRKKALEHTVSAVSGMSGFR